MPAIGRDADDLRVEVVHPRGVGHAYCNASDPRIAGGAMSAAQTDDTFDWEAAEAAEATEATTPSGGYVSPLMQRVSHTRLSADMLRKEIPLVRDGNAADAALSKATSRMGDKSRAKLVARANAGKDAKQRLYEAALPLIRVVAKREYGRRRQWGSQVSLEELMQEASIGFLKGINSFRVEAIGKSATNYLGQWMLVEMRRASEALDHDMQVGHDAGERFRRIRALRLRLASELGREPTDDEIAEASRNPHYIIRPGLVGRAPAEGEKVAPGKGVTVAQVAEERTFRGRLGFAERFGAGHGDADQDDSADSGDMGRIMVSAAGDVGAAATVTPEDQVAAAAQSQFIAALVDETLQAMGLPAAQREVVSRRYGIPPYPETSAREIAKATGLQRDKVSRVLAAFQEEMTRKGGVFHRTLSHYAQDDLYAAGLDWIVSALGPWSGPSKAPVPDALTQDMGGSLPSGARRVSSKAKPVGSTSAKGVMAWFQCDFHDRVFSYLYPDARSAPKTLPCPACSKASERVKTAPMGA